CRMLRAAPEPRPPQPIRPTLITSLPWAWTKGTPARDTAAAVAAEALRKSRRLAGGVVGSLTRSSPLVRLRGCGDVSLVYSTPGGGAKRNGPGIAARRAPFAAAVHKIAGGFPPAAPATGTAPASPTLLSI